MKIRLILDANVRLTKTKIGSIIRALVILGIVLAEPALAQESRSESDSVAASEHKINETNMPHGSLRVSLDLGTFEFRESQQNLGEKAVITKIVKAIQDSLEFELIRIDWAVEAQAFLMGGTKYPGEHWNYELLWNRRTSQAVYVTGVKPKQRGVAAQYIYSRVTDTTWIKMFEAMDDRYIDMGSLIEFGARKEQTDMSGIRREL